MRSNSSEKSSLPRKSSADQKTEFWAPPLNEQPHYASSPSSSLGKFFPVKERVRLQFRAEFLNYPRRRTLRLRVLTPEEKPALLQTAASRPDWQIAKCAGILGLSTTVRGCELKGLRP